MPLIRAWTPDAIYQGQLDAVDPARRPIRLLEALNAPQRLAACLATNGRLLPLRQAVREDRATGEVASCGEQVWLRVASLLAAHELPPRLWHNAAAGYERRASAPYRVRVRFDLERGLRIEGTLVGRSATPKQLWEGTAFVAAVDVALQDPQRAAVPQELPFLAVNLDRMSGYSILGSEIARDSLAAGAG